MSRNTTSLAAGGALLLFAAVAGWFRIRAYDLFWHLAAGRWILEHRTLPRTDPFRFSSDGLAWIDHGWLFQVAARSVESVAGLDALVALRAAAAVLLAALVLAGLRRAGTPPAAAVIVAALAVLGARPRLMLRPETFSVVAVGALMFCLQELRRSRAWAWVGASTALAIVWSNVHAGVLLAPVLAAAFLAGCRLPGGCGPGRGGRLPLGWDRVLLAPGALALAVAANPWGFALWSVPRGIGRALDQAAVVNPEWLPAWSAPQPALLAGGAALVVLVAVAAVRTGRVDPATGLAAVALAALAAGAVRHQGLFFIGAAFLAGESLADLARAREEAGLARARWAGWLAVGVCALAAAWCVWTPDRGPLRARIGPYSFGTGVEPGRFPVDSATALERWPEVRRPYNDAAFGGYLLWRRYPRQVFLDGRNEVDPGLIAQVARARSDSRAWRELIAAHGIDGAVVRYDDRLREVVVPREDGGFDTSRRTTHALLFPRARFALVHWDDTAMVLVARTGPLADRIEGEEYRFVHPEDWRHTLERAAGDPAFRAGALAEVERKLREDPTCQRAAALLGKLRAARTAG